MSATSVKLLQAAADIVGGNQALAQCLGVAERTLAAFLTDTLPLPDSLLLRAVDIILTDRQRTTNAHPSSQWRRQGVANR